jgi:hypothetical protein
VQRQIAQRAELYADPLISLQEFAAAVGSPSYSVIRRWIVTGELKTWRVGKGHHKVRLSELRRFLASGENVEVQP